MIADTGIVYEGNEFGAGGKPGLVPGLVLGLLKQLRERVGTLKAKEKQGVRFKVRSLDELVDKMRGPANELGLLIYPVSARGTAHQVEDGTLADCTVRVRIQAVEDGSYVDVEGFGLGADNQDKAGGKAGSYAFKQALVQALLAGGAEDTDDSDSPIKGGVRAKTGAKGPSVEEVSAAITAAQDPDGYRAALQLALKLKPDQQLLIKDVLGAAKLRCTPAVK